MLSLLIGSLRRKTWSWVGKKAVSSLLSLSSFFYKIAKGGQLLILSLLFLEIHVNWKRTHAVYMYVGDVG
jgi:hypothetical protein